MAAALDYFQDAIFNAENDAVLLVDSYAPVTLQITFESLWTAGAVVAISVYIRQKSVYSPEGLPILVLPG